MLKKKKIKKDHYNISKVRIWSGGQGAEGDACQKGQIGVKKARLVNLYPGTIILQASLCCVDILCGTLIFIYDRRLKHWTSTC